MEKLSVDDVEPGGMGAADRRGLSEPLDTSDLAINYYHLQPGEGFSGGLHAHMDQEELFFIIDGEATFELPDETVTVGEREAIRFAPGEFQRGSNESDSDLTALALGAPRDSEDVRVPQPCPEGDSDDMRIRFGEGEMTLVCPECGTELEG